MRNKPILCVDFDGVIHSYTSGWQGATVIPDPPVPGALAWLWKATEWWDVQIYSARSKDLEARAAMLSWMIKHSLAEFGEGHPMSMGQIGADECEYPITFVHEKPAAFFMINDRAICFDGDWSELDPCDMLNFQPWNRRPPQPLEPRRIWINVYENCVGYAHDTRNDADLNRLPNRKYVLCLDLNTLAVTKESPDAPISYPVMEIPEWLSPIVE